MGIELGKNLEGRKIAVFGATSKIGSEFAIESMRRGAEIVAFERNAKKFPDLPEDVLPDKIIHIEGDITDRDAVFSALVGRKVDATVNFAAVFNQSSDVKKSWPVNVAGEEHVLEASRENDVKRHVFISTTGVHIKDNNAYKVTKLKAEELVRKSEVPEWMILRYGNVVGTREPNDLWNKPFITREFRGKTIGVPKIPVKKDAPFPYLSVETAVEATIAALDCKENQTLTVFDGITTVGEYISTMQKINEIDKVYRIPSVLLVQAIGIGNFILGKRFPITYGTARFLMRDLLLENETMQQELGIATRNLNPFGKSSNLLELGADS